MAGLRNINVSESDTHSVKEVLIHFLDEQAGATYLLFYKPFYTGKHSAPIETYRTCLPILAHRLLSPLTNSSQVGDIPNHSIASFPT